MIEAKMLNRPDVNNQSETSQEAEKQRAIDKVFADYAKAFHDAVFTNEDDEMPFDIRCANEALVSEALPVVETVADCDRILSELNSNDGNLSEKVWAKRDSIEFKQIIEKFDTRHKAILEETTSSSETDELLESMRCNELRLRYLCAALKKAATQQECLEVLGRTCDCREHAYIRQLVNEKMATLPVVVR